MIPTVSSAVSDIFQGISRRSRPHLARAISLVENESSVAAEIVSLAYKSRKGTLITGVTGSPGVGKSTLINGIVSQLRGEKRSVGIIAVDPSSPFTGGSILGDRVRMSQEHTLDDGVFFRSLATRGHLGGLSRHTGDAIALLDAFGFDDILVETVGAGQSEIDIMKYAHTVVVVLAPGLGDDIQMIKAGILEIGDVFCVNKSDLPGADRARRDIEMMLDMKESGDWHPPIVSTSIDSSQGFSELVQEIRRHQRYLVSSDLVKTKNRQSYRAVLEEYLNLLSVERVLDAAQQDGSLNQALEDLIEGRLSPMEVARRLINASEL